MEKDKEIKDIDKSLIRLMLTSSESSVRAFVTFPLDVFFDVPDVCTAGMKPLDFTACPLMTLV